MNILELMGGDSRSIEDAGRIYGVVIALVTQNKDPEQLGRVKLRFPWLADQDESDWVRVAVPMAGSQRGAFFLPEVNDEVLVAFDHGDVRVPYVIGALWNGKDKPPETNSDGKNDKRLIRSRAGHELLFDDNDRNGQVMIKTRAGHKILLDDTSGQTSVTVVSQGGNKITMDDARGITISDKSGNEVVLDAGENAISLQAKMKISLKAQMIEIVSDSMMEIKTGGSMTIKGTMVQIN